jgi:hypothetical protein
MTSISRKPPFTLSGNLGQVVAAFEQTPPWGTPHPTIGMTGTTISTITNPGWAYRKSVVGTVINKPPVYSRGTSRKYYLVTVNAELALLNQVYMTFLSFAESSVSLDLNVIARTKLHGTTGVLFNRKRLVYKQAGIAGVEFPHLEDLPLSLSLVVAGSFPLSIFAGTVQTIFSMGGPVTYLLNKAFIRILNFTVSTISDSQVPNWL